MKFLLVILFSLSATQASFANQNISDFFDSMIGSYEVQDGFCELHGKPIQYRGLKRFEIVKATDGGWTLLVTYQDGSIVKNEYTPNSPHWFYDLQDEKRMFIEPIWGFDMTLISTPNDVNDLIIHYLGRVDCRHSGV